MIKKHSISLALPLLHAANQLEKQKENVASKVLFLYSAKQFFKLNDPKIVDKKFEEEEKKSKRKQCWHVYAMYTLWLCAECCAPLIKFVMKVLINISWTFDEQERNYSKLFQTIGYANTHLRGHNMGYWHSQSVSQLVSSMHLISESMGSQQIEFQIIKYSQANTSMLAHRNRLVTCNQLQPQLLDARVDMDVVVGNLKCEWWVMVSGWMHDDIVLILKLKKKEKKCTKKNTKEKEKRNTLQIICSFIPFVSHPSIQPFFHSFSQSVSQSFIQPAIQFNFYSHIWMNIYRGSVAKTGYVVAATCNRET